MKKQLLIIALLLGAIIAPGAFADPIDTATEEDLAAMKRIRDGEKAIKELELVRPEFIRLMRAEEDLKADIERLSAKMSAQSAEIAALKESLKQADSLSICSDGDPASAIKDAKARKAVADALSAELKARDTACRQSHNCGNVGACGYDTRYEGCMATKPEHCARARICTLAGLCGLGSGEDGESMCRPRNDADCRKARVCKELGRCISLEGECR